MSKTIRTHCPLVDLIKDAAGSCRGNKVEKVTSSSFSTHGVMSADLSSNFAELKKISATLGSTKKRSRDDAQSEKITDDNTKDNTGLIHQPTENDLKCIRDRQRQLAEETTLLAKQEVQRMHDAVAELEAILAAGDSSYNIVLPLTVEDEDNAREHYESLSSPRPTFANEQLDSTSIETGDERIKDARKADEAQID